MTNYGLSDRQKNLLRVLVPNIKDETLDTTWGIVSTYSGGIQIPALRNKPEIYAMWREAKQADIDDFVDAGFFRSKGQNEYTLRAQAILDAVNSDFDETESASWLPRVTSVFGDPSTAPQFQCDIFMVMPFRSELDNLYKVVKSVSQDLSLVLRRGDEFSSAQGIIINEVWSAINACRLVIADCTPIDGQINGNVYYETGIADALHKPVILITQDVAQIPFDLRHRRFIVYNHAFELLKTLKTSIDKILHESAS